MNLLSDILRFGSSTALSCQCNFESQIIEKEDDAEASSDKVSPELYELTLEYSWFEVVRAVDNFSTARVLGRGLIGTTYKAQFDDGLNVAVKVLNAPTSDGFTEEMRLLARVHHPHVVMLLGYSEEAAGDCTEPQEALNASQRGLSGRRALIYESLPNGSAYSRLHSKKSFSWHQRLRAAMEAARGVAHLHKFRPQIFHRDIKTANILFDVENRAKIADFGLACTMRAQQKNFRAGTASGYTAPEFVSSLVVNEASEIFSMGMVLLELFTSRPPSPAGSTGDASAWVEKELRPRQAGAAERLKEMADTRAKWPPLVVSEFVTRILDAIHEDPLRRPSFLELVGQLQQLLQLAKVEEPKMRKGGRGGTTSIYDVDDESSGPETSDGIAGMVASPARGKALPDVEVRAPSSSPQSGPVHWLLRKFGNDEHSEDVCRGQCELPKGLNGRWVHKHSPEIVEIVKGDLIHGPNGTISQMTGRGKDSVSIELDGSPFHATRAGNELFWSDGDIWIHCPEPGSSPTPQKEDARAERGSAGSASSLPEPREDVRSLPASPEASHDMDEAASASYNWDSAAPSPALSSASQATMQSGPLQAGAQRLKQLVKRLGSTPELGEGLSFEGRWEHKDSPGVAEIITGSNILGPEGKMTRISSKDPSGQYLCAEMYGSPCRASRVGDELRWDNGVVWVFCDPGRAEGSPLAGQGDGLPPVPPLPGDKAAPSYSSVAAPTVLHAPGSTEGANTETALDVSGQEGTQHDNEAHTGGLSTEQSTPYPKLHHISEFIQ